MYILDKNMCHNFVQNHLTFSLLILAVKCYECHEVDEPKNCSTIVECPSKDHVSYDNLPFLFCFYKTHSSMCCVKTLLTLI